MLISGVRGYSKSGMGLWGHYVILDYVSIFPEIVLHRQFPMCTPPTILPIQLKISGFMMTDKEAHIMRQSPIGGLHDLFIKSIEFRGDRWYNYRKLHYLEREDKYVDFTIVFIFQPPFISPRDHLPPLRKPLGRESIFSTPFSSWLSCFA